MPESLLQESLLKENTAPALHRTPFTRLAGVGVYLPEQIRTSAEVERLIARASGGYTAPPGIIEAVSGIRSRHVAAESQQCSDLAALAARAALADAGAGRSDVDLLIFASAGQDLLEPATSVITAHKLGLRCPAFDIKNACNSLLNGIEVASALIAAGQYQTVLVVSGEVPSRCIRWQVANRRGFRRSFPGYTFGDAGAALLLTASDDGPGFVQGEFVTEPKYWDLGTLSGGGSMHPRGDAYTYFEGDGARLRDAFLKLGTPMLNRALAAMDTELSAWDLVLVHQVTVPMHQAFLKIVGLDASKTVLTVDELGNCAAASMPLQLHRAICSGQVRAGSRILWIGLAGGISVGIMGLTL